MRILLLILFIFCSPSVFAANCVVNNVNTGYGYITNSQSQIVAYADYPLGTVCIPVGNTYTEVPDQATLNSIPLYQPPVSSSQLQANLNAQALNTLIANQIATTPSLSTQQATITAQKNAGS